jgi:hypothetical protein
MDNAPQKPTEPTPDAGHIPMTEELDSPKWTLPPVVPMVIALVGLAIIVGIALWTQRPVIVSTGQIDDVFAVEQQGGKSTLVAIHLTLSNSYDKPMWIRLLKAELTPESGDPIVDEAASAVDFPRYYQAYPELAQHALDPLKAEDKIATGESRKGMIVVAFPVSKEAFEKRKGLAVDVDIYDRHPLRITKK